MPIDYSGYPPHWPQLRAQVLDRAGGACECVGECGRPHHGGRCRVVLTVAHLDHDPQNHGVAVDRLRAMCQACHLRLD